MNDSNDTFRAAPSPYLSHRLSLPLFNHLAAAPFHSAASQIIAVGSCLSGVDMLHPANFATVTFDSPGEMLRINPPNIIIFAKSGNDLVGTVEITNVDSKPVTYKVSIGRNCPYGVRNQTIDANLGIFLTF